MQLTILTNLTFHYMNNYKSKNKKEIDGRNLSEKKKDALKELFMEELSKNPIIQSVCQKLNVSRATIYRWFKEDVSFKDGCNYSIIKGNDIMNDVAKHQLFNKVKEGHYRSLVYYLSRRHPEFIEKNHDYKISEWWQMFRDENFF